MTAVRAQRAAVRAALADEAGFSLVEMLVVAAVVGVVVVVAVAFVLGRRRGRRRGTVVEIRRI